MVLAKVLHLCSTCQSGGFCSNPCATKVHGSAEGQHDMTLIHPEYHTKLKMEVETQHSHSYLGRPATRSTQRATTKECVNNPLHLPMNGTADNTHYTTSVMTEKQSQLEMLAECLSPKQANPVQYLLVHTPASMILQPLF